MRVRQEGYHLSEDLVDKAIEFIADVAEDFAENHNVAAEHRDRLIAMIGTWYWRPASTT